MNAMNPVDFAEYREKSNNVTRENGNAFFPRYRGSGVVYKGRMGPARNKAQRVFFLVNFFLFRDDTNINERCGKTTLGHHKKNICICCYSLGTFLISYSKKLAESLLLH